MGNEQHVVRGSGARSHFVDESSLTAIRKDEEVSVVTLTVNLMPTARCIES